MARVSGGGVGGSGGGGSDAPRSSLTNHTPIPPKSTMGRDRVDRSNPPISRERYSGLFGRDDDARSIRSFYSEDARGGQVD